MITPTTGSITHQTLTKGLGNKGRSSGPRVLNPNSKRARSLKPSIIKAGRKTRLDKEGVKRMYMISRVKDVVRIPPERINEPINQVANELLNDKYAGLYDKDLGIIIGVFDVETDPIGKIIPNDGGSYHKTEMTVLSLKPVLQEIVEAPVIDVKEFGIFIKLGPVDGFIHKSQLSEEFVEYDPTRPGFILRDSHKTIEVGDIVRARIIAFSFAPERQEVRIQLTMRQPYLGKIGKAQG